MALEEQQVQGEGGEPTQQSQGMSEELQNTMFALSGVNEEATPALSALGESLSQQTQATTDPAPVNTGEPSLVNSDLNHNPNTTEQPVAEAPIIETPTAEKPAVETPAVETPVAEANGLDSPLFSLPTAPTEEATAISKIEGIEGVNTFISEKHPDIKDLNGLMTSYDNMTSENASLLEMKVQNEKLINGLSNLDPDLVEAIRLYESGEDYREYLNTQPNISYDSKVEDVDSKTLINAFYPGKVSDEDFEAANKDSDDYDPNVARFVDTVHENAVAKFNETKAGKVGRADNYLAAKEAKDNLFRESVGNSLSSVKDFFPDATPTYIKGVEEKMLNDGIKSLFFDENGQAKPDAAARFVRASDDGANLVSQLQKIAYNQATTDANLNTLTRGQRTAPENSGREMRQDEPQEQVNAWITDVMGSANEQPAY